MKVDTFCASTFLNHTTKKETPYSQNTTVYLTMYLADGGDEITHKTEQTHHWQCCNNKYRIYHLTELSNKQLYTSLHEVKYTFY